MLLYMLIGTSSFYYLCKWKETTKEDFVHYLLFFNEPNHFWHQGGLVFHFQLL